jgi:hypothetical protein
MSRLAYSSKALNTLPKFHRRKFVVYVEGQDDAIFWGAVFRWTNVNDFHIKIAGGKYEIKKFADAIVQKNAAIWVAQDCDYSELTGTQVEHRRIMYTYGYSIENSLYCPKSIAEAIERHSRTPGNYEKRAERWLNAFARRLSRLILFDLANEIHGKGLEVLGQNCTRFLTSKNSHEISRDELVARCQSFSGNFTRSELAAARRAIANNTKPIRFVVKGHFLTAAVANYIKNETRRVSGRTVNISNESLFVYFSGLFLNNCPQQPDIKHLRNQARRLSGPKRS